METFELYLFKSGASLSLLYIFYWLILKNETYHSLNRIFLMGSLILSFLTPMFSFSIQNISSGTFSDILEPVIIDGYFRPAITLKAFDALSILSIIYISGAVFFCLRFLSSLAKMHFLYFRFPRLQFNGFEAVVLDSNQTPFTFFNILFISRVDYESGKINEMIVHEKAHRDGYHSFDIVLLEIMTIIQWFNPFIWMFRRTLKFEHEFIADNKVLLEGFDKVKYQKLLFERSLGISTFNLTNGFNYSLLKKRLKMMTLSKSSSLMKVKYLLSMPMLLLTILLTLINFNSFGQKDKIYSDVDVIAEFKNGGMQGLTKFIQKNINYPKSAQEKDISARIYVQFVVDEKGKIANVEIVRTDILDKSGKEVVVKEYKPNVNTEINSKSIADMEAEAVRVIKLMADFKPAQKDGKNVESQLTIPINFVLEGKKDTKTTSH